MLHPKDVFQGNEELLEGFEGNNPLKESDSYEITLKEVKSYKQVVSHLETIDGVRKVRYSEGAAEGMMKINTMGTYLAGGIILILMAVSIFLVSNTVSIGVAVREEEISIMKLIGAANGFIKAPFQAEGMIYSSLWKLSNLSAEGESGIPCVAVKCVDIWKNTSGESGSLVCN